MEESEETKHNVEFANSEILNEKGNFEPPPYHKSYNNNPLHHIFLPAKPCKTYNYNKINQSKALNSATDGDIFPPIVIGLILNK